MSSVSLFRAALYELMFVIDKGALFHWVGHLFQRLQIESEAEISDCNWKSINLKVLAKPYLSRTNFLEQTFFC
jgi:hypothetical protein